MIDMIDFDKLENNVDESECEKETPTGNAIVEQTFTDKSISDVTLRDVHFKVDGTKTYEEQTEDVVGAMTIVKAVEDEGTMQALATGKQSELIDKQQAKVKQAQKKVIDAETDIQKARFENKTLLFDTFNITAHLPKWLQAVIEPILGFFYILFVIVVKVPCGLVRMLIDGIDAVLVRYEKKDEQTKPKIKVTVIILIVLVVVTAVTLGTLYGLKII